MAALTVEITGSTDPAAWDAMVSSHPAATIFQASAWGRFQAEYLGYEAFYLTARDEAGRAAALLQGFFAPRLRRPMTRDEARGRRRRLAAFERTVLCPILPSSVRDATWQFGPLFFSDPDAVALECAKALETFFRHHQIVAVNAVTALPDLSDKLPDAMGDWFAQAKRGFKAATIFVDLRPSPEELWRGLKGSARKAIRSAEREGVTVRPVASLDELQKLEEFFWASRVADRPIGGWFPFENLAVMWKHLRPAGCMEFFVAERAGEALAGLGIWRFHGHLIEFAARQTQDCLDARIYAPDLIKWEIIRWGHATGARVYDLAGVAPRPATGKERGIRQFKEKWGGVYVEYALRRRVLRPATHYLLAAEARLHGLLRRAP